MRIREKGYADYGFSPGEAHDIMKQLSDNDESVIREAARKANPSLADLLTESLLKGLSYEELDKKYYVPISKIDFYGYRRYCLYLYKKRV